MKSWRYFPLWRVDELPRRSPRRISRSPIDPSRIIESVAARSAGGTVVFVGTVRDRSRGKKVTMLEYQVYLKMAELRMDSIESEVAKKWPGTKVSMVHRAGRLKVGDVSVVVAVSAEHRAQAFEACRYAVERIKSGLPLWKRELAPDGSGDWVEGNPIAG